MKKISIVGMLLLVGLLFVAGCSTDANESTGQSQVVHKAEPQAQTDLESPIQEIPQQDTGRPMPSEADEQMIERPDLVEGQIPPTDGEMPEGMLPGQEGIRGRPQGEQGVPQEAIDACTGSNEGDSCFFSTPRGDMGGTCSVNAGVLACGP